MQNIMLEKAKQVMDNAYAPYSNFHVGACIRTEDDELFVGCNVENISYSLTLCAESVAIGAMIAAGQKRIKEILVIGSGDDMCSPCGACRQRIMELSLPDTKIHMCKKGEIVKTVTRDELLPFSFSADLMS